MFFHKTKKKNHRSLCRRPFSSTHKKNLRTQRRSKSTVKLKKKREHRTRVTKKKKVYRKHKHDLTATGIKHNPFIHQKPIKIFFQGILRLALLVALGFLLYIFMSHSALQINNVQISGAKNVNSQKIETVVYSILAGNRFNIFPSKHYLFVPVQEIQSVISEKFPVDTVAVKKIFPGSLSIFIEEQVSSIIYDNTMQYFLVDKDGKFVEPLRKVASYEWVQEENTTSSTTTKNYNVSTDVSSFKNEHDGLPIFVDVRQAPFKEDISLNKIQSSIVSTTIYWQRMFNKQEIDFLYIAITDPRAEQAAIHDKEGRVYMISLTHEADLQLKRINTVLEENPNAKRIDVRFLSRVYWE